MTSLQARLIVIGAWGCSREKGGELAVMSPKARAALEDVLPDAMPANISYSVCEWRDWAFILREVASALEKGGA